MVQCFWALDSDLTKPQGRVATEFEALTCFGQKQTPPSTPRSGGGFWSLLVHCPFCGLVILATIPAVFPRGPHVQCLWKFPEHSFATVGSRSFFLDRVLGSLADLWAA